MTPPIPPPLHRKWLLGHSGAVLDDDFLPRVGGAWLRLDGRPSLLRHWRWASGGANGFDPVRGSSSPAPGKRHRVTSFPVPERGLFHIASNEIPDTVYPDAGREFGSSGNPPESEADS